MDERQREMISSAMAKALAVIYAVVLIIGVTKITAARSIPAGLPELIFAVAVPILVYFFARGRRNATFPMTIAGLEVKPDRTRKALNGRIRAYLRDSLPFAAFTALFIGLTDLLQAHRDGASETSGLAIIGSALVEFMILFAVCFAVDYAVYEWKARKDRAQKRRKTRREKKYKVATDGTNVPL